jgi:hypothetical protein
MNENRNVPSRTREQVEELIGQWKASGIGKKEFCAREGIKYQTFVSWFYKRFKKPSKPRSFIPIEVQTPMPAIFAEIQLSNSRKIIFHQSVNIEFFQAILKC